ncbi:ADP-ribosylation factor 4-like [Convolutriloba macropyga]|uniref:ADP-ribosylation factor 4-like n=1 Tax=Convolutriloba macropyga TaxID=536237 RepID=UPI003F528447
MGALSSIFFKGKEMRILMAGLDNAGKSTVLAKMANKSDEVQTTVGFNVDKVKVGKVTFNVWDVGGQDAARPLWRHYFEGTRALIYVFDSTDRARLQLSLSELKNLLQADQLTRCPLLILLNKQDAPEKLSREEMLAALDSLKPELENRAYLAQPTIAIQGVGLIEGFRWLANQQKQKKGR